MKLDVLIVDDTPLSRQRTRRYLADEPDVTVVGECGDAESALEAIRSLEPDLVLLDVQMPGTTGLGLLERLPAEERPAIVFITAFDEFAVQAFAVEAVDYLLKPFDKARLGQAIAKVRAFLARRDPKTVAPPPYLERIAVKSVGRTAFVSTAAIDWIETEGNYLSLHMGKDTKLVRETMSQIEAKLDPRQFVRIHRSTIVRIDAVKEITPLFNGDQSVILNDGTKVVLSRSYREKARAALGLA
jgi:two-component system, LytTR family, response regulator